MAVGVGYMYPVLASCVELKSQDDEELQWLMVAKQGKGVEKSDKRRESAETEYHRLLCEESMQEVRGRALAQTQAP